MRGPVDVVLLDRIDNALRLSLPIPSVPVDERGAYALALLERGHTPNRAGNAVGVAPRDLRDQIGDVA